jgi:hypothetical protein
VWKLARVRSRSKDVRRSSNVLWWWGYASGGVSWSSLRSIPLAPAGKRPHPYPPACQQGRGEDYPPRPFLLPYW